MTNPEQPAGPAHPARALGYALIGVAVIALVIGLVSLFIGDSDDDTSTAQSQSQSPSATSSDTSQTGDPTPPTPAPSETSPTTPTTGAAPTTTANPGATTTTDTAPPPVSTKPPVRVYNNSTTRGLAADAALDVQQAGWQVAETGNYSQGLIPTTTVYYRPGTDEEASARDLARVLNARVESRFDGIEDAQPGIIVIVTNDYKGPSPKGS
ncbi:hypothetical protein ALI22I_36625 [Saccharothrix sp. ALI-22-I]|uniref:LytR C-terminal domain-containing protein n=1 Tax=Saccharothrix sp. ALI-22-I TaxID=1933778 RepID=UPI00097BB3E5|nr:LytR C-terminal domain-containing protein [Saccharothrix sp. ALI-22-I]ONI81743.1 hypothetical protein ALI22I_36625 [Saccharothrix sp. ALI-22-I]